MEELNLILDNLPMMMVLKDTKDNIIRVNKTFANAVGLSVKKLSNVPTKDIFPIDYEKYYQDDLEVIQSKKGILTFLLESKLTSEVERKLIAEIEKYFKKDINFEIKQQANFIYTKGKLKNVISKINE